MKKVDLEHLKKIPAVRRALYDYLAASALYGRALDAKHALCLNPKDDRYYNAKADLRHHDRWTGKCPGCRKAAWWAEYYKNGRHLRCMEGKRLLELVELYAPPRLPETIIGMFQASDCRTVQRLTKLFQLVGARATNMLIDEAHRPEREASRKRLKEATAALLATIPVKG